MCEHKVVKVRTALDGRWRDDDDSGSGDAGGGYDADARDGVTAMRAAM